MILGLGVMGAPMARHLAANGHKVTVYNRTPEKALAWVALYGNRAAPTPREAAEGAEFVFMCVGNDNDVREVVYGVDGALAGAEAGAVLVDHTTDSAEVAKELAEACAEFGVGFVDAGDVLALPEARRVTAYYRTNVTRSEAFAERCRYLDGCRKLGAAVEELHEHRRGNR